MDETRYTLTEHLGELRTRLLRGVVVTLSCAMLTYAVSDDIFALMKRPLADALPEGSRFVVVSPLEYVMTTLEIALTFGLVLASPYVIYQLWLFVAPGLYAHEQRTARLLVWAVSFCFLGGASFCYFLVFPVMVKFLVEMTPPDIAGMYSVSVYFGFFLRFMLGFGLAFELPVAIVLLCWLGILDPATLAKARKYAIVLAFVAGGVLTPTTDPYSQTLMAVPLIILYEVGLHAARLVGRRNAKDAVSPAQTSAPAAAMAAPAPAAPVPPAGS